MTETIKPLFLLPTDPRFRRNHYWKEIPPTGNLEQTHGCSLGCIYCNQKNLDKNENGDKEAGYLFSGIDGGISINTALMYGNQRIKTVAIKDIIKELHDYPFYTTHSALLMQNYTDPGLNWSHSIEMSQCLVEEFSHQGPLIYITKMGIGLNSVRQMQEFQRNGAKPIVIVTYSGMPKAIEPASGRQRISTMRKLKEAGIPVVMSMRPMIETININEDNIRQIAREAGPNVDRITVGGLYVYPSTPDDFAVAGYPLPDIYTKHQYPVAKVLPSYVRPMVRQIMKEEGVKAVVHDHTTCAVADIMTNIYGNPCTDRIAHWAGGDKDSFDYCETYCPSEQLKVCRSNFETELPTIINKASQTLKRIGYDLPIVSSSTQAGLLLVKDGSLTIGELFTIAEECGWAVNNWPSYEGLIQRTKEALEMDMGISFDENFVNAISVGQEWIVIVKGDLDGRGNALTVKWVRSRNRARIRVMTLEEYQLHNGL